MASDDNRYDGLLRAAEEAVCLPAGTLTAAGFEKALDEMWNAGPMCPLLDCDSPARAFEVPGVYSCGAVLFPLPAVSPFSGLLAVLNGWPPDPDVVHGPAPAVCAREPHEASPWHWDGKSTWWR